MTKNTREPKAPESYATFWEFVPANSLPSVPPACRSLSTSGEAKDAYLEFMNITEGIAGSHPA